MMKDFLRDFPENTRSFKNIFTTSDHHFGHAKILDFEPIRTKIMEEEGWTGSHDDFMIDNWNKQVGPDDLVLHLGDFSFKGPAQYAEKLNGTILLVLGNHDRKPQAYYNIPNMYVVDGFWEYCHGSIVRHYHVNSDDTLFSALLINNELFSHYPIHSVDPYDNRNPYIGSRISLMQDIISKLDMKVHNTHGHSHSQTEIHKHSTNVCIDNNKFKFIRLT